MPCFLFTYHAHGSWLPDHRRGYVKRGKGIQPINHRMAAIYGENLKRRVVVFDETVQRVIIEAFVTASEAQECRCRYIAAETTHVHALVTWSSERMWEIVRKQLRYNATRRLNELIERREWFSKSPSRRQVRDRQHYDYLVERYLPRHSGLKWSEGGNVYR